MDVFTTHLAFAFQDLVDLPVFALGDERIDDAASYISVSTKGPAIKLTIMTLDGLPGLRTTAKDVIARITHRPIKITNEMSITCASLERVRADLGEASYADRIDILLSCDIETTMRRAA